MDFRLPELGEGVYEAEVVRWLVKPGDVVKRAQVLMEVLTDKATMEVPAPFAGTIDSLRAEPGSQVKIGDVILTYGDAAGTEGTKATGEEPEKGKKAEGEKRKTVPSSPAVPAPSPSPLAAKTSNGPMPKAAPTVRQLAHKLGIDLRQVAGSGPAGRILADDLTRHIQSTRLVLAPAVTAEEPPEKKLPPFDLGKPGTRIKLQGVRRRIAEHMVEATRAIPHYTYVDECDVSELVKMRESLRETVGRKGIKLTYLPFLVKAVVNALKEVPIVNSSLDESAGEIVLHDQYNIGLAVAAPSGLIVPVIAGADKLDLLEIARQADRLSNEARLGKSRLEDLRGGTFTITSIGSIGGLFATPIIHQPQVAILGIGKIVKRPVFDEHEQVRPAHMMYLSISCDHRVLDGAVAAVFGNAIIRHLQNPAGLLLAE
jgi:pyruvate/2-oxoglutarate dehydrogenase complex dihydrolipoamide acyltransferase (E2) component